MGQAAEARLDEVDLVIDATYKGTRSGHAGDDPLWQLLGVSNQGGFRHLGKKEMPRLIVLTTSMSEPDWPDSLDSKTGILTYFGDNRHPGQELHKTRRWGNQMLRDAFARAHSTRLEVPPILVFSKAGTYRDVRFLGLAVPGAGGVSSSEDLVATWHQSGGNRFQNYRALFTILDVPVVTRKWLRTIRDGGDRLAGAPKCWTEWINGGPYVPLRAVPTQAIRSRTDQLPKSKADLELLDAVRRVFQHCPSRFERFAARLVELHLPDTISLEVTRPSRDGGRDAVGKYRIGGGFAAVEVDFAMEAKCYAASTSVSVRDTSRLISRLRHRQFGVLVTTSFVNQQAYQEIVDDGHPIIVICGRDVVDILKLAGIGEPDSARTWALKAASDREG
ncbi:restriction endonuclease [Stenotrophomonas rhizophila]